MEQGRGRRRGWRGRGSRAWPHVTPSGHGVGRGTSRCSEPLQRIELAGHVRHVLADVADEAGHRIHASAEHVGLRIHYLPGYTGDVAAHAATAHYYAGHDFELIAEPSLHPVVPRPFTR